jgi:hypothetical protein
VGDKGNIAKKKKETMGDRKRDNEEQKKETMGDIGRQKKRQWGDNGDIGRHEAQKETGRQTETRV